MSLKIGFAIITYNEPGQLLRLVKTLNAMFDAPPIVCHHDFSQCPLDEALFPPNVRFVHPHIGTGWCHINTLFSAFKAFRLLRDSDQPDWFVLLSGSDYPVRPASEILAELSSTNYDVYLENREILSPIAPTGQTAKVGYGRPSWIPLAYDRYLALHLWLPLPSRRRLFPFQRRCIHIRNPVLIKMFQAGRPSRIFGGAFWLQLNRKAMDRLLDDSSVPKIVEYFGARPVPEEALFHTILCNQPDLTICNDHKRYEDWVLGASHPSWLEVEDVTKMRLSGAHFARKFRADGLVQDVIDETVLGIST